MFQQPWRKSLTRAAIAAFTTAVIVSGTGLSSPQVPIFGGHFSEDHFSEDHSTGTHSAPLTIRWTRADQALATSGGRASGGSFGSSGGGGSSSGGSSSGGSSSGSSSSGGSSYRSSDTYSSNSYSSSGGSSEGSVAVLVFWFIVVPLIVLVSALIYKLHEQYLRIFKPKAYQKRQAEREKSAAYAKSQMALAGERYERTNDQVTVTQLQVAMLASARDVQQNLNDIATDIDWGTPTGLNMALTETALALLRSPEYWTHVSSQSQSFLTRESAKQHFDQLSLTERSKFEMESLVNVGGKVRQRAIVTKEDGPADYIVATLIVGTAHDQPLFESIQSTEDLRAGLKTLGAIAPDYLMVYELLWSPQDASDSLTYDELLLHYPHMLQIA